MGAESNDSLWAISCYFNPLNSAFRLSNFRTFARRLGIKLLAVELAHDGVFDLTEADADVLIRIPGGDVLWQKECLLNLAIDALPPECEQVAWLDGDIVFADPDWSDRVSEALKRHAVVQVFDRLLEPEPHRSVDQVLRAPNGTSSRRALASGIREGRYDVSVFERLGGSLELGYTPGHGWAASRALLEEFHLYDALVLGTGDKAIAAAAYGRVEDVIRAIDLDARHADHFRAWAEPFARAVGGDVGSCENTIVHLWHGDLAKRRYATRYCEFRRFDFDPTTDIRLAKSGAWLWNSAKPQMHAFVRNYFAERCEDGDRPFHLASAHR